VPSCSMWCDNDGEEKAGRGRKKRKREADGQKGPIASGAGGEEGAKADVSQIRASRQKSKAQSGKRAFSLSHVSSRYESTYSILLYMSR